MPVYAHFAAAYEAFVCAKFALWLHPGPGGRIGPLSTAICLSRSLLAHHGCDSLPMDELA
jgi:hypothetical protein